MLFRGILIAILISLGPGVSFGGQLLSDDELDKITASGSFEIEISPQQEISGIKFNFDAGGGTSGFGDVQVSSPAAQPSLVFNGANLSGNLFSVENMILNMNICVSCSPSGNVIQTGNGFVIPINAQ